MKMINGILLSGLLVAAVGGCYFEPDPKVGEVYVIRTFDDPLCNEWRLKVVEIRDGFAILDTQRWAVKKIRVSRPVGDFKMRPVPDYVLDTFKCWND